MKKVGVWTGAFLCLAVLLAGVGLGGCDDATGSTKTGGDDTASADLSGTWMKVFDTPFTYEEGHTADFMLLEVSGTAYNLLFFLESTLDGGNKGSFTATATQVDAAPTHTWNRDEYWVVDTVPFGFPYSLSGDVLTLTAPDETQISLTKTVFSRPAGLVGTWARYPDTEAAVAMISPSAAAMPDLEPEPDATATLNSDGTYTYVDTIDWDPDDDITGHSESGPLWDATGTTSGYMRWYASTYDEETDAAHPWIAASVFLYELSGGNTIRVYWPVTGGDFDLTLTKE